MVLGETTDAEDDDVVKVTAEDKEEGKKAESEKKTEAAHSKPKEPQARDIAEVDRRVGELEKLVGSSNATLDEVLSPLPSSAFPVLTFH